MKTITSLLLALALISCTKSPDRTYPDITGTWAFHSPSTSGQVTIVKTTVAPGNVYQPQPGTTYTATTSFSFILSGTQYQGSTPWAFTLPDLSLSVSQDTYIVFHGLTPAPDFKSMSASSFDYSTPTANDTKTETITFSRP